jgi:hypothetical protein
MMELTNDFNKLSMDIMKNNKSEAFTQIFKILKALNHYKGIRIIAEVLMKMNRVNY